MGTHHQPLAPALLLPTLRTPCPGEARKPVLACTYALAGLCPSRLEERWYLKHEQMPLPPFLFMTYGLQSDVGGC